jgi:hypothetical protein
MFFKVVRRVEFEYEDAEVEDYFEADEVLLDDGALVFAIDNKVRRVYASMQWKRVESDTEPFEDEEGHVIEEK